MPALCTCLRVPHSVSGRRVSRPHGGFPRMHSSEDGRRPPRPHGGAPPFLSNFSRKAAPANPAAHTRMLPTPQGHTHAAPPAQHAPAGLLPSLRELGLLSPSTPVHDAPPSVAHSTPMAPQEPALASPHGHVAANAPVLPPLPRPAASPALYKYVGGMSTIAALPQTSGGALRLRTCPGGKEQQASREPPSASPAPPSAQPHKKVHGCAVLHALPSRSVESPLLAPPRSPLPSLRFTLCLRPCPPAYPCGAVPHPRTGAAPQTKEAPERQEHVPRVRHDRHAGVAARSRRTADVCHAATAAPPHRVLARRTPLISLAATRFPLRRHSSLAARWLSSPASFSCGVGALVPVRGVLLAKAPARGIRPFARLLTPPHAHAMHRLCNACGLYYLKKKQVPQAAVPMALVSRTHCAGTVDLSREKHGAARASGHRADGAGGDGEDAREGCAADAR